MRKALVTNARRYTGPDATRALLAEGLAVYCHDKSFANPNARQEFENEFSGCIPLSATDPEAAVEEALGDPTLDVLFCNHFQPPEGALLSETTADGFRGSLETLLIEPYRFIHAALPALIAGTSPRIVLVTSAAGQRPMPRMTMYAAA
jgi:NAD(P)-dependent dehydrogenase (short-subunit alcohol dehydrogenase family)